MTISESPDYWNSLYDTPDGKTGVDIRQMVYQLLKPGVEAPDYDQIVIEGAQLAGISNEARILDIGCSFPRFLQLWRMAGHKGELIGIDPNVKQFGDLPYWELRGSSAEFEALQREGNPVKLAEFFRLMGRPGQGDFEGIKLYRAGAGFIPLQSDSVDLDVSIFSGYHAFVHRQALEEAKRVLKVARRRDHMILPGERAGISAFATSGNENKRRMQKDQVTMASLITIILKQEIAPPPPLQDGFTSEDAAAILPEIYKYVYRRPFRQEIVYNLGKEIVLMAHRTFRPSFRPASGELPTQFRDLSSERPIIKPKVFEYALQAVVAGHIDDAMEAGRDITDIASRDVFFGSDEPIDELTELEFKPITG